MWVRISPPSLSQVVRIARPPRQLSTELQLLTISKETATKVIYQLWQEARSEVHKALQFWHLSQEQEWSNRAETGDWQPRFTGTKIQNYPAASGSKPWSCQPKSLVEIDDCLHWFVCREHINYLVLSLTHQPSCSMVQCPPWPSPMTDTSF